MTGRERGMTRQVGIVGLGIMGSAIARNILASGAVVAGFDIDAARLAELGAQGGTVAASAAEVAGAAEIVLTSLPSTKALDATVEQLVAVRRAGQIVCELSTLPIADKQRARDALAAAGITLLDCPLSGTGAQAVTRDLAVYASGDRAAYDRAEAVFPMFSRVHHYLGAFGNGSRMKFVANLLVAIHNVASAEAMVLGIKSGLDPATIVDVIQGGAGNSRVFELRAPLMAQSRYEPASMKIDIWQKDMAIIAEFAAGLGVTAPLFAATAPLYDAAVAQGLGSSDTAAVCAVLEGMAGLRR
ncbi:MAG: 6-phosphogluconate dehydrogenase NAD-binding protein [Rhodospirillales bacterium]|jgi:putative dehydrogenase|nr:6-phosphogluconate dehydrogenase NAD-binding protein [Rhodospirillales bacterium]